MMEQEVQRSRAEQQQIEQSDRVSFDDYLNDYFAYLKQKVMKVKSQTIKAVFSLVLALVLSGCATSPPRQQNNLCEIFRQKPSWYEDALDMNEKWGTPINVAMAFIKQESSFVHNAKPPRYYALGFIPQGRELSLTGFRGTFTRGVFSLAHHRHWSVLVVVICSWVYTRLLFDTSFLLDGTPSLCSSVFFPL